MEEIPFAFLKYLAFAVIIYLIFRFVPAHKLSFPIVLRLSGIITMTFVALDLMYKRETVLPSKSLPCNCEKVTKESSEKPPELPPQEPVAKPEAEPTVEVVVPAPVPVQAQELPKPIEKKVVKQKPARSEKGVIKDELPYTDYNHIPMGDRYKDDAYLRGYSFLPPKDWYPTPPFPPVCIAEKQCPVCPVYTSGVPVGALEFDSSRRVTPPDNIKVEYVEEKLNSGR